MRLTEETHSDIAYLRAVTELLQRARNAHPTLGVWEAADFQWWWRKQRPSDRLPQFFWRDAGSGHLVGAVTRTDWRGRTALDIISMPNTDTETLRMLWRRGLGLVSDTKDVDVFVDTNDEIATDSLIGAGFADSGNLGTSAWLQGTTVLSPPLADGYRLRSRADKPPLSHHLDSERNGFEVDERLRQTSLYRPDLDLYVTDETGAVCAFGLFWFDPATHVGFVEPMGTVAEHRRRGLASRILAEGISRLKDAGSARIKINYENENVASSKLYTDTGFQAAMTTTGFTRSEPIQRSA